MSTISRRVCVIVVVLGLLGCSLSPIVAQDGTPPASPPVALPETPVGDHLAWVLEQFNSGARDLTEQDIVGRFHPEFLTTLPPTFLVGLFQETAAQYAPIVLTGFAYPPTETGAIALATADGVLPIAITITVEPDAPNRITRLEVGEPAPPPVDSGQRVDIGGRFVYLNCTGEGSPTVVLEGGISSDWNQVQPAVSQQTRVCSYDRPDSPQSHSDPTSERTAQQVVDDLHAALAAAGEEGPFVLVGHSMGGLYVQLFAYQHPEDIAGLVLVDPTPEDFSAELGNLLRSLGTPIPENTGPMTAEQVSFQQMNDARESGPMPQVPLVLLSHGVLPPAEERPAGWPLAEEEALFRQLHQEILGLVPGSRHIVAEKSLHDIHMEEPELVIAAISDVVSAARDLSTWASPVATP